MDTEIQVISSIEDIKNKVYMVRGLQVMLDYDLAKIYGYEVKRLNEIPIYFSSLIPSTFSFIGYSNFILSSIPSTTIFVTYPCQLQFQF